MAGINSIDKIQRDLANTQRNIKSTLAKYKSASNENQKKRYTEDLKKLQKEKKELDAKLEKTISTMHSDAELDLDSID